MQQLPTGNYNPYNQKKFGIYGEFSKGANSKILFIETVIKSEDLDNITLISNIPGSEKWQVRDLFQRDVDHDRVESSIIPYLKNQELVKYFNPITLLILPMSSNGRDVLTHLEYIVPVKPNNQTSSENQIKEIYEKSDYYKLSVYNHIHPFAEVEWKSSNCYLVAIDGQHRISALKRWKSEPNSEYISWDVPAIILNIFKDDPNKETPNLLEIVRRTFVYINSKSEKISRAREILLNDESINALCTQELIQYSHENDIRPFEARNQSVLPLLFYDWHSNANDKNIYTPSIKTVEEIHDWFEEYLLGHDEEEKDRQYSALELRDLVPPLSSVLTNKPLNHSDSERIRFQFRKVMLEGLLHLLQNFIPYNTYTTAVRQLEREIILRSDLGQHAFMKLRFGSHNGQQDQINNINTVLNELFQEFETIKRRMPFLIQKEVGLRGILFAYSECRTLLSNYSEDDYAWLPFSIEFTKAINIIYAEGWFDKYEERTDLYVFLENLVYDQAGSIINYKISQAKDALGALFVILVFSKFLDSGLINEDVYRNVWDEYSIILRKTYEKSFRKQVSTELRPILVGTVAQINAQIKQTAEERSNDRIIELNNYIQTNMNYEFI